MSEKSTGKAEEAAKEKEITKKTWGRWPRNKFEWFFAVMGLLLAILAIPQVNEFFFESPAETLAKRGYQLGEMSLWTAVLNQDKEAVNLFVKAGVKLDKTRFQTYITQRDFSAAVAADLIRLDLIDATHCPGADDATDFYTEYLDEPSKMGVIRALCADTLLPQFRAKATQLQIEYDRSVEANEKLGPEVNACVERYAGLQPTQDILQEAVSARMSYAIDPSERSCVLSNVYGWLHADQAPFENWVRQAAEGCCEQYIRTSKPEAYYVDRARSAIKALEG